MWTRKGLKQKAKIAVKRSYWKTVLAAFLFSLLAGGGSSTGRYRTGRYRTGGCRTDQSRFRRRHRLKPVRHAITLQIFLLDRHKNPSAFIQTDFYIISVL